MKNRVVNTVFKKLREEKNLSYRQVARKINRRTKNAYNLDATKVERLEHKEMVPALNLATQFAAFFNTDIEGLFYEQTNYKEL